MSERDLTRRDVVKGATVTVAVGAAASICPGAQ